MWRDSDPAINNLEEDIPKIIGYRQTNHSDISRICQMMKIETFDLFGDVEAIEIFEKACLSLVQINEEREVISNVSLCNFPNVPSVPANDWLAWITMHYGLPGIIERNTLFIHMLVWECRYDEAFFETMLKDIFDITLHCLFVILIVPPGIKSDVVDVFEKRMKKYVPRNEAYGSMVQTLYVSSRYDEDSKLKIRRVVEEDNDDLIPIIDDETKTLRELYGDYYISEMMRFPDEGNRQLIVAENNGQATGVMCLNRIFDIDILIENFELVPYNDLRKSAPIEPSISPPTSSSSASTISSTSDLVKTASEILELDDRKSRERQRFSLVVAHLSRLDDGSKGEIDPEGSAQPITKSVKFSERHDSSDPSVDFESVIRKSVFAEVIEELPIRSLRFSIPHDEDDEDLPISQFSGKTGRTSSLESTQQDRSNAFVLELFSMKKSMDERHAQDYLEAAFECFPDLDYCAILLPPTRPFFPLLEHFVRVPLRFDRDFPMVLYLTHRATLLSSFGSREAMPYDRDAIVNFLQTVPRKNKILNDFDESLIRSGQDKRSYVFLCNDKIVGLAIICSEFYVDELCLMYNVKDYVSTQNTPRDSHSELLHFIMVPIFSVYHRVFFCELMRLSSTLVIYYRLFENETTAVYRTQPLITCLDVMIPLESRTRIHHPYPPVEGESMNDEEIEHFSLFLTTPRFAMMSKSHVNAKIVIVGASDCGVAFAEYLAFRGSDSDIGHFTNVTIVSSNGMPFEEKGTMEHATMIPFKGRYCYQYRKVTPTRVWINVVPGIISYISRKEKYVTVSGHGTLSFDYLILTCGMQYQIPKFHGHRDTKEESMPDNTPLNCFFVNDDTDASTCLERLKELTSDFTVKKFIVMYGRNIDCYCALNNLLENGVKGSWIILIEPKFDECEKPSDIFFEDDEIIEAVTKSLLDSGIKIISGWNLQDWVIELDDTVSENDNNRTSVIKSLLIESKTQKKYVACDALIYFGDKTIPVKTFLAISRAGLVFDGRLIIDPANRTNDRSIFAAGSITKYSKKYGAGNWQHQYYNSLEVGEKLAKKVKEKIVHNFSNQHNGDSDSETNKFNLQGNTNLPVFRAPLVVYCRLPGGLHYLHVRKPGKKTARVIDIARGTYGEVMITGSASATSSNIGYFRVRLNQFDRIETITCLRKKDFKIEDLITLWGKHERMLNNLKLRFKNSLILDFFAYFAEPWTAALYHDNFDRLRVENRTILLSGTAILGNSLIQDSLNACIESDWKELRPEYRRQMESKYAGSVYHQAISSNLMNFLLTEEESLPMYCNPRKLTRQLQND